MISSLPGQSTTIYESTTAHLCGTANVEHACASPCLREAECTRIQVHLNKLECRGKVHLFQ